MRASSATPAEVPRDHEGAGSAPAGPV